MVLLDSQNGFQTTQQATNSAAHVRPVATDIVAQNETTQDGSATVAAAGLMATLSDIEHFNVLMLHVTAVTTSVDITGSLDGTNYGPNMTLIDMSTQAAFATAAITATGVYKLSGKFKSIKITAVGAGAATVKYLLGVE